MQVRKHSAVHEGLTWDLCSMLARQCCAGSSAALPKRARASILEALQVHGPLPAVSTPVGTSAAHRQDIHLCVGQECCQGLLLYVSNWAHLNLAEQMWRLRKNRIFYFW